MNGLSLEQQLEFVRMTREFATLNSEGKEQAFAELLKLHLSYVNTARQMLRNSL